MRAERFNSLPQLATVLAGFVVTIVLLESHGLAVWAERMDVGPARTLAVRVTSALENSLRPLRIEWVRRESLQSLDRIGWTDDPARLLAASRQFAHAAPAGSCSAPGTSPARAALKPASPPAASIPVPAGVPSQTALSPLPEIAPGAPRVVALVGDSMMAVGLGNVLLRDMAGNPNLRVVRAFKSGTGLARPDVFDWMDEYPAMIGNEQPDAIIVAIGANDGQGFVENGKVLAFGTEAWATVYQHRTEDFLTLLTSNGARVVWVGLPPMQSSAYNQRAAEINCIAYSVVSRNPLATWWNPQPIVGDKDGDFRELLTAPNGKTTRIRSADGIHLSDDGAALLAPELMRWLNPAPAATAQATPPAMLPVAERPAQKMRARKARSGGHPHDAGAEAKLLKK